MDQAKRVAETRPRISMAVRELHIKQASKLLGR